MIRLDERMRSSRAIRIGAASAKFRPATALIVAVLCAALFVLVCVDVGRGDFPIGFGRVLEILGGSGRRAERFIVLDVRLPRAILGVLVGAALGVAGALTQSTLRNPLAGPDLLGISSGAAAAAVAVIVLGGTGGVLQTVGTPAAALCGGLATAAAIYLLAWRRGYDGFRLVLIGIGINAMLVAVIGWLLVYADLSDVARAQIWLNGSLNSADWSQVWMLGIGLAIVGGWALLSANTLAVLRFSDDKAASLGVRLQFGQASMLLAAVVLASLATAAAGPVGFVALAAPQIARMVIRSPGEPLIASAVVGAITVVGGDVIARTILPVDLPVGIVTSGLGGVFLLLLLVRTNRKVTV